MLRFVFCCHFLLVLFVIKCRGLFYSLYSLLFFMVLLFLWFFIVYWGGGSLAKAFGGLGVTAGLAADRTSMTGVVAGQQFFETDTKKMFVYSGSVWVQENDYTLGAMTVDASGRVTLPYQPRFYAQTTGILGAVGGYTKITYSQTSVNTGNHYSTSTGLFTAPVSGVYYFVCGFQKRFAGGLSVQWYINGSSIGRGIYSDLSGDSPRPHMHLMWDLTAGNTVSIYYTLSAGDVYGTSAEPFTYFTGWLLG